MTNTSLKENPSGENRIRIWKWSRRRSLTLWGVVFALWLAGLFWFAGNLTSQISPDAMPHADAIVVLTGGKGRLHAGFALLAEGKAPQLFVSGVNDKLDARKVAAIEDIDPPVSPDLLSCCVTLGYKAGNTIGNAEEAAAWLTARNFHAFYLVTAHYHIRRALLEFRMALPGAVIYPVAVAPDSVRLPDWWEWPGTATLIVTEYNKFLVAYARYGWFSLRRSDLGREFGLS